MAGFGDGADIDEVTNAVGGEERDELFDGVRGVADGEDYGLRHEFIVNAKAALYSGKGPADRKLA